MSRLLQILVTVLTFLASVAGSRLRLNCINVLTTPLPSSIPTESTPILAMTLGALTMPLPEPLHPSPETASLPHRSHFPRLVRTAPLLSVPCDPSRLSSST